MIAWRSSWSSQTGNWTPASDASLDRSAGVIEIGLYIGIPVLIVAAIIQPTILPRFTLLGLVPNLVLLIVVAWSFHRGPNEGIVFATVGGLISDLGTGTPLGISSLSLMAAALTAGAAYRRIYQANLILPALITLPAVILYQALFIILLVLTGQPVSWHLGIVKVGTPLVLLHFLLMPIFYYSIGWLTQLASSPRKIKLG